MCKRLISEGIEPLVKAVSVMLSSLSRRGLDDNTADKRALKWQYA